MKRSHSTCPVSRRSFLASAAVGLAGYAGHSRGGQAVKRNDVNDHLLRARRKASHRRRRLIINDDGGAVVQWHPETGPEGFRQIHLEPCIGAPVDSYAWCVMYAIAVKGYIKGFEPPRYWETQKLGKPLHASMPDPTPVVAEYCRQHGTEVFGSIRMNDCHDALGMPRRRLLYPLKVEHPEFLLGDASQRRQKKNGKLTLAATMWSGLDYAHREVREDRFGWINHTASRYDLDGVDLNFFRMPWFFKVGEEARHMHLMTDLIRRARRRFDAISRQRGRPMLLGVRVPDTAETCLRIGLDVETWLKEGLIDRLITGGGYVPFSTPAEELVKLGHRYDVPVYPSINTTTGVPSDLDEAMSGAASNLWYAGADGLYLWNFFYRDRYPRTPEAPHGSPPADAYQQLPKLAEPKELARLDKIFAVDATGHLLNYGRACAPVPLPLKLGERAGEAVHRVRLRIGDDVQRAARSGFLRDICLQLKLVGKVEGDRVDIKLNGADVTKGKSRDKEWLDFDLKADGVKQGDNTLQVAIAERGPSAKKPLVLKQVWCQVRYQG